MPNSPITAGFPIAFQPFANPGAVVTAPQARFTVLTDRLLRLEFSPSSSFEDRPSQLVWYRYHKPPKFTVSKTADALELSTDYLRLRYKPDENGGFSAPALSIELFENGITWHYGQRDPHNLHGTVRTLDEVNGRIRLEPGLVSRSGWSLVDDSHSLVFEADGWLQPRSHEDNLDLYFFGYGHDYLGCLAAFCQIAGQSPLIPRWALGSWWSRYWPYSQAELLQLMDDFKAHDIPLSVCIVDMDWHVTETGNESAGWTGYTWNRQLFPDPVAFIAKLHHAGLKTALNLHPAAGVYPHEEQYPAMAKRMGIDPRTQQPVPFEIANPLFAEAYFDILHHPMEAQGVDFWWIDWQQGQRTKLAGLDPLWWLNHLHFYDLGRGAQKRPLIFSRWGGLGNHRYPIGFSGDTVSTWASLAFQPYFTATAANVAYGWWSHDIGGHMYGERDAELYARWVQYGVFSPILRLHSTNNPYLERRPWGYDHEVFHVAQQAMQLRHALIPYIYSMAWKNTASSRPLALPMYYLHPEEEDAYHCQAQYYYGSELLAAPFTSPRHPDTNLSKQAVWLPAGEWFDFFSGQYYSGGWWQVVYGGLADIPVFARAGAIVPLGPRLGQEGTGNPSELDLYIFPGASNSFELYEDDGETQAYQAGHSCLTTFAQSWAGNALAFTIQPAAGETALIPARRSYTLHFRGIRQPDKIDIRLDGKSLKATSSYDNGAETLAVSGISLSPANRLVITLKVSSGSLISGRDRRLEACRQALHTFRVEADACFRIDPFLPDILAGSVALLRFANRFKDAHLDVLANIIRRNQ